MNSIQKNLDLVTNAKKERAMDLKAPTGSIPSKHKFTLLTSPVGLQGEGQSKH